MLEQKQFSQPAHEYRPIALWGWDSDLQDEKLIRQIDDMERHGWGGFVMAPRFGLQTPYLSSVWMDRVATCVAEARKRGMKVWIYDDDIYPAGFAGGLVSTRYPEYRMKGLVCREHHQYRDFAESVRVFLGRREEGELREVAALKGPAPDPKDGRVFLHFYQWTQEVGVENPRWRWHPWSFANGFGYIDVLNPQAVREFLDTTHAAYYARFGADFGTTILGSFMDEPALSYPAGQAPFSLPWTPGFPAYFAGRTGYSVLDHLPSLFYDVGDYRRVRYDFWRAMTQLFLESWSKQLGDWCREHNLLLSGHYLAEETLVGQVRANGAVMPHYAHEGVVGVEKLREDVHGADGGWNDHLTMKQADSVACQLGKPRLLSETGLTRTCAPLEARKWVNDWQYLLGVNLLESGIVNYSVAGVGKRDWSPRHSWHQPWWPWNGLTEDYFGRLSYALTQGRRVADVLVIHPIASAWLTYRPQGTHEAEKFDHALADLVLALFQMQRDFHFGDEMLMEQHARVEGSTFWIGQMPYRTVIVPPALTLSRNTIRLLEEFARNGGVVIACEPLPTLVEGAPAGEDIPLLPPQTRVVPKTAAPAIPPAGRTSSRLPVETCAFSVDIARLRAELERAEPASVQLADAPWIWYHQRVVSGERGEQRIFFLANTSPDTAWTGIVRLAGEGRVEEWNPHTGKITPLFGTAARGYTEVWLAFPEAGSHLIVLSPGAAPAPVREPAPQVEKAQVRLGSTWSVRRVTRENALTLDYAEYRVADGPWNGRRPLPRIHEALRLRRQEASFELKYTFEVGELPAGRLYLVSEAPDWHRITLNGQELPFAQGELWLDVSFKRLEVTDLVRLGENEVCVAATFARGTMLEAMYLIGDLAVEMPSRRIVREPKTVQSGHVTTQGYLFFAGILGLSQSVVLPAATGQAYLELQGLQATMAVVWVNGQEVGPIAFHPHKIEVTGFLRPGPNEIEVQLVGNVQNLLGPHHYRGGEPFINLDMGDIWAGDARWTDAYEVTPLGLDGARILWCA
jgi:hypothetical protein